MKNTSYQNSSYIGGQKLLIKLHKKNSSTSQNKTLIHNILKSVSCILVLIGFTIIYYLCQKIPVRKHYFQVEYIASSDSSSNITASIEISHPKTLDLDEEFHQSWYDSRNKNVSSPYSDKCIFYINSNDSTESTPYYPDSKMNLSDHIGKTAFDLIANHCDSINISTEDFSDVFLYRHFDNEKTKELTTKLKTHLSPSLASFDSSNQFSHDRDYFVVVERNFYSLSDSVREKELGLNKFCFRGNAINPSSMDSSKFGFKNLTQSFIVSKSNHAYNILQYALDSKIRSKFRRFFYHMSQLEDISQSYYLIKVSSKTIPYLKFSIDFTGTIDCNIEQDEVFNHYDYKINRSSISLYREKNKKDMDLLALVKHNDMQNMQNFRLYVLGALFTLVLAKLVTLLYVIVRDILQKKKEKSNKETTDRKNYLSIHEKENGIPSNTPDYYINPPGID